MRKLTILIYEHTGAFRCSMLNIVFAERNSCLRIGRHVMLVSGYV